MRLKLFLLPLAAAVFLIQIPAVRADIVNGDFSVGLTGWTPLHCVDLDACSEPDPGIPFITENEEAILKTEELTGGAKIVTLLQELDIPASAQTLSFRVWFDVDPDPNENGDGTTINNFLWISYLDDDGELYKGLLGFDYLGAYLETGVDPDGNNIYEYINNSEMGQWFYFEASIADLAGRSGTIYFDLEDQDDDFNSTVKIDDVAISSSPVPEPSTLLLLGSGILGILGYARKRRASAGN